MKRTRNYGPFEKILDVIKGILTYHPNLDPMDKKTLESWYHCWLKVNGDAKYMPTLLQGDYFWSSSPIVEVCAVARSLYNDMDERGKRLVNLFCCAVCNDEIIPGAALPRSTQDSSLLHECLTHVAGDESLYAGIFLILYPEAESIMPMYVQKQIEDARTCITRYASALQDPGVKEEVQFLLDATLFF